MPAADKLELLSVKLGRFQGLGVLVTKLFLHTLMSCTATAFMPGTLLGSSSPAALTADTDILPKSIKGSSLEIKHGRGKFAISSRQSEKSHDLSYKEFPFLYKAKCCSGFF